MKHLSLLSALLSGLVFGLGLMISGMTDPARVKGFLDLAGMWNPSLAFVMAGAIAVGIVPFRWLAGRPLSLLGESMQLPTRRDITPRLVLGSIMFGIGWAIAGICPGPALVRLGGGSYEALVFVLAMLVGMKLFAWYDARRS